MDKEAKDKSKTQTDAPEVSKKVGRAVAAKGTKKREAKAKKEGKSKSKVEEDDDVDANRDLDTDGDLNAKEKQILAVVEQQLREIYAQTALKDSSQSED